MIITAIISIFAIGLVGMLRFLPISQGFSPEMLTSFQFVVSEALKWDYYLPIALGMRLLFLMLGIYFVVYLWSAIRFVYSAIRGARI